jgi:toxin HigB-1
MIKSFAHKGLEKFFLTGNQAGIHAKRLRLIMALIDKAMCVEDMDAPGLHLHPRQGDRNGLWALTVQANWRVVFRFEAGDAYIVDSLDYH